MPKTNISDNVDLIDLQEQIEETEARFQRVKNFVERAEVRKQYSDLAKKYNQIMGRKVYNEKI